MMKPIPHPVKAKWLFTGTLLMALGVQTSPYFYKHAFNSQQIEYSQDLASTAKEEAFKDLEKAFEKEIDSHSGKNANGGIKTDSPTYVNTLKDSLKNLDKRLNSASAVRSDSTVLDEIRDFMHDTRKRIDRTEEKQTDAKDSEKSKLEQELKALNFIKEVAYDASIKALEKSEGLAACDSPECKKQRNQLRDDISDLKKIAEASKKEKQNDKEGDKESKLSEKQERKKRTSNEIAKIRKECVDEDEGMKKTKCYSEGLLATLDSNKDLDKEDILEFFNEDISADLQSLLQIGMATRGDELSQLTEKDIKARKKSLEAGRKLVKKLLKAPKEYSELKKEVVSVTSSAVLSDIQETGELFRSSQQIKDQNPALSMMLLNQAERSRLAVYGNEKVLQNLLQTSTTGSQAIASRILEQLYKNPVAGAMEFLFTNPYDSILVTENGQVIGITSNGQKVLSGNGVNSVTTLNGRTPLVVTANGSVQQQATSRASRSGLPGQLTQQTTSQQVVINGEVYQKTTNNNITTTPSNAANTIIGTRGTRQANQPIRGAYSN